MLKLEITEGGKGRYWLSAVDADGKSIVRLTSSYPTPEVAQAAWDQVLRILQQPLADKVIGLERLNETLKAKVEARDRQIDRMIQNDIDREKSQRARFTAKVRRLFRLPGR